MDDEQARAILAEEMNKTREPSQRQVTADQFKDGNYKSYIAAVMRAYEAGRADEAFKHHK